MNALTHRSTLRSRRPEHPAALFTLVPRLVALLLPAGPGRAV